jgi:endo-1,4-beta-mannosidase
VSKFQPYVQDTVKAFLKDDRVLYWEVYNEPRLTDTFSVSLRSAAYAWITELNPIHPILSCWDDNNSTDVVDSHHYDTDFQSLTAQVYMNVSKGALITEGGSRWYQGYSQGM